MKKQITSKLQLNKETLRNLSDRDLTGVVGGHTATCQPTGVSLCEDCPTDSCLSNGGCVTTSHHCC